VLIGNLWREWTEHYLAGSSAANRRSANKEAAAGDSRGSLGSRKPNRCLNVQLVRERTARQCVVEGYRAEFGVEKTRIVSDNPLIEGCRMGGDVERA
jgi:hypothetical protein